MLHILRDVASALDYAHEQGVIHRDVKPSNVMLEKRSGRAILMDFGLALSIHEGTTGDTFGSAHYIAPEQAISSAKSVSQSDLYSLGVVIYEMLAGKVPFDDPSAMSVALKHLNEVPPPPSLYNPDLPPQVEAVIMRVLDKDPHRRYRTGSELIDALETAFASATPPDRQREPAVSIAEKIERRLAPKRAAPSRPVQVEEFQPRGVAGRFARRKARKEEEAALQTLDENALQIDDDTLNSLLDSYADPRDIGLVGPEAKGITLPERPSVSTPPAEDLRASLASPPKRRSRIGLLLSILLVLVVAGGAWFAFAQGDGDETPGVVGLNTEEATLSSRQLTGTAQRLKITQTAQAKETATVPAGAVPDATNTPRPTRTPTREATEEVVAVAPSETPAATSTSTPAPSDTPRPPTATMTRTPTATATPEDTATRTPGAELRMVYDDNEFLLINISDRALDISDLVFEQETTSGATLAFSANTWQGAIRMDAGGCYQLLATGATQGEPPHDICTMYLGWFRSNLQSRYFWISDEAATVFTVRHADEETILGTCQVGAGQCEVAFP
jgi:hypothetical protein